LPAHLRRSRSRSAPAAIRRTTPFVADDKWGRGPSSGGPESFKGTDNSLTASQLRSIFVLTTKNRGARLSVRNSDPEIIATLMSRPNEALHVSFGAMSAENSRRWGRRNCSKLARYQGPRGGRTRNRRAPQALGTRQFRSRNGPPLLRWRFGRAGSRLRDAFLSIAP
jgi:hypothetical protein